MIILINQNINYAEKRKFSVKKLNINYFSIRGKSVYFFSPWNIYIFHQPNILWNHFLYTTNNVSYTNNVGVVIKWDYFTSAHLMDPLSRVICFVLRFAWDIIYVVSNSNLGTGSNFLTHLEKYMSQRVEVNYNKLL